MPGTSSIPKNFLRINEIRDIANKENIGTISKGLEDSIGIREPINKASAFRKLLKSI